MGVLGDVYDGWGVAQTEGERDGMRAHCLSQRIDVSAPGRVHLLVGIVGSTGVSIGHAEQRLLLPLTLAAGAAAAADSCGTRQA